MASWAHAAAAQPPSGLCCRRARPESRHAHPAGHPAPVRPASAVAVVPRRWDTAVLCRQDRAGHRLHRRAGPRVGAGPGGRRRTCHRPRPQRRPRPGRGRRDHPRRQGLGALHRRRLLLAAGHPRVRRHHRPGLPAPGPAGEQRRHRLQQRTRAQRQRRRLRTAVRGELPGRLDPGQPAAAQPGGGRALARGQHRLRQRRGDRLRRRHARKARCPSSRLRPEQAGPGDDDDGAGAGLRRARRHHDLAASGHADGHHHGQGHRHPAAYHRGRGPRPRDGPCHRAGAAGRRLLRAGPAGHAARPAGDPPAGARTAGGVERRADRGCSGALRRRARFRTATTFAPGRA